MLNINRNVAWKWNEWNWWALRFSSASIFSGWVHFENCPYSNYSIHAIGIDVVCLLLRKFVDCAIFVVCFPTVYNFGFFECLNLCSKSTSASDTEAKILPTTKVCNVSQHSIHSHRWRWIMYFTWAHRISIYIYKVSSFAFASDEQRRALNFHDISIDSLLNSNKLFVTVFQAVFCMHASDANEKKNVLTVHKKKSVTAWTLIRSLLLIERASST